MTKEAKGFLGRMLDAFKGSLIDERLEADLYPVGQSNRGPDKGEISFFRHTQGHLSIKARFKGDLGVESGQVLELVLSGAPFARLEVADGPIKGDWNQKEGEAVPEISIGDRVQVCLQGQAILEGVFEKD